jgi:preprotein translocase subunit SecD
VLTFESPVYLIDDIVVFRDHALPGSFYYLHGSPHITKVNGQPVFMLLTYRLFGVFANIAVAINVAMIFGVLSLLNATLTLPGIAGIVLTVGIAVDSNVLIYERIREELRGGRTAISAIDAGFKRALSTILDSNITTFIAAAVLFYIGTGPVRGFAVTLGIGIITTVFTAFTLTSLIVAGWVRWKRPKTVPI